ncbi:hypothetical protein [uncultured Nocardioides sp.]|uniref:DUF4386 family protein n=1 Tax=uncultured Nocardioides sp. TaxID=198441 RepID=A0A6J4N2U6_9ACTN|nr:hypothetical protein [uncultured Nocardioides sp.]CAA9376528.1 MAG: hypothetical protein AVDCRST_MAG06-559 [uncultured Nocardioides sp.]
MLKHDIVARRPRIAAALVVTAAVANAAESIGMRMLLPPQPEDHAEALALVAAHRPTYAALTVVGTLAVPLLAAAFWVLTGLAREHTPRLALTARGLLLAGMWGFLGMHVVNLAQVPFSADGTREAGATAIAAIQSSPVFLVLFLLPFLLGCALGLLLLAIALLRSPVARWIPLALLAFLVVDFGLRNAGPVDAHWLFVAASVGAAREILRQPSTVALAVESSPRVVTVA